MKKYGLIAIILSLLCFTTQAGITDIPETQPVESRYYLHPIYVYAFWGKCDWHGNGDGPHGYWRTNLIGSQWLTDLGYKKSKIRRALSEKLQSQVNDGTLPPGLYMYAVWIEGHHWAPKRWYREFRIQKPKKQKNVLLEF